MNNLVLILRKKFKFEKINL